jgi:hypothetical protein
VLSSKKNALTLQISVILALSAGTSAAGFGTKLAPVAGFHRASPSTALDKDIQFVFMIAGRMSVVKTSKSTLWRIQPGVQTGSSAS